MSIVNENEDQLYVLVNHIYERKISYTALYKYIERDLPIVYRTIYEMTNNHKDEITDSIVKNEAVLTRIIDSLKNPNLEIQNYAIRIIGNILAEREDYAYDLMKYQLLDQIYPLLTTKDADMKRDGCWLVSNYAFESGPATEVICKQKLMDRLIMMFKNETKVPIKIELYYIFSHLVGFGDK